MKKTVLLVEDEEHDVLFMQLALERAQVSEPLVVVGDGKEAIAYLKGKAKFADRKRYPLPSLVLLDLRLPFVPGFQVLEFIRGDPKLKRLPVIIFSSSNQEADVNAAYRLGANAYIVKPAFTELVEVVRRLKKYWLDMDEPPPDCAEWLSVIVRPEPN